jgi:hypothetical protein
MKRILQSLLAFLVLAAAPSLRAQDATVLGAGTRVRLTTPLLDAPQQTGKVVSATRDTITFMADSDPVTRTLAVSDITSIEISGGMQTHRWRDANYGFLIGFGAGAIAGALSYKKPDTGCLFFCETRRSDTLAGGILGGLAGTLVGAFVVGSLDKTERWVPLRQPVKVSLVPTKNGAVLAFSRSF